MTKVKSTPGRPILIRIDSGMGPKSECYALSKRPVTLIGRARTADVRIPMEFIDVSREHALIRPSGDNYVLEHRSSHNPTRIIRNDQTSYTSKVIDLKNPGEQESLQFNDIIMLSGAMKLKFVSDTIDADTQQSVVPSSLQVVLNADVVGYCEITTNDADAELTHQKIVDCYEIFRSENQAHGGKFMERVGDCIQVVFSTATAAVSYAKAVQHNLAVRNSRLPVTQQVHFRIGCDLGEIFCDEGAKPGEVVCGEAVNLAQRIQERAQPGGVSISGMVYEALARPARGEFKRAETLPHVGRIVEVYQLITPMPPRRTARED